MELTGGCLCGAERYRVTGAPVRVGLCHCADCRKETGSAFLHYADWPRESFEVTGAYATWEGRSFCPACGSRLFHLSEYGAEICVGSLDAAPSGLVPEREIWIRRREGWLAPVAVEQFGEDGR
jgi:hypothetical protein